MTVFVANDNSENRVWHDKRMVLFSISQVAFVYSSVWQFESLDFSKIIILRES